MGFTVYHPGGTKDHEFEAYVRLLRQQGVDLGKLPRVPEILARHFSLGTWISLMCGDIHRINTLAS